MQLQLALDTYDSPDAISILDELEEMIDIAEVGTPLIIKEGVKAVREIKEAFPNMCVLADLKIMDGGELEASYALEAGADIVTVLAVAEDDTIRKVIKTSRKYGKKTMIDMIAVKDIWARTQELDKIGADYLCVHTAYDVQYKGKNPLKELKILKANTTYTRTAVAGGIKLGTIEEVSKQKPDIIIVGGGITTAKDKFMAAKQIKEKIVSMKKGET